MDRERFKNFVVLFLIGAIVVAMGMAIVGSYATSICEACLADPSLVTAGDAMLNCTEWLEAWNCDAEVGR